MICDPIWEKRRLNENYVEPFLIVTHLKTLKCVSEHSQCILTCWQYSPTELRNVQYHFKTFKKRIQTLTMHLNETSLIRGNGKHSQDIPTLSMIELQKENSEL